MVPDTRQGTSAAFGFNAPAARAQQAVVIAVSPDAAPLTTSSVVDILNETRELAHARMVTPAERIGTLWVIDSGLKAGDRIVVEGLQKVRAGMKVKPAMVAIKDEQSATASGAVTGATADAKDAQE